MNLTLRPPSKNPLQYLLVAQLAFFFYYALPPSAGFGGFLERKLQTEMFLTRSDISLAWKWVAEQEKLTSGRRNQTTV